MPASLATTNTLDRASSLLRAILTSDESFGRYVTILSTGCLFRIVCPPASCSSLSLVLSNHASPVCFSWGVILGRWVVRELCLPLLWGVLFYLRWRPQFWPVIHSLYLKTVTCTLKTVPFSSSLVLPYYCLPEWPWVPRFSRVHSDCSMPAPFPSDTQLWDSMLQPESLQSVLQHSWTWAHFTQPTPLISYWRFQWQLGPARWQLTPGNTTVICPKAQWRARAESQQFLCWNL